MVRMLPPEPEPFVSRKQPGLALEVLFGRMVKIRLVDDLLQFCVVIDSLFELWRLVRSRPFLNFGKVSARMGGCES